MENYYDKSEDKVSQYFENFNSINGWFKNTERQARFSHIDYFCTDTANRNVSVELKLRYEDPFKFDTIFIEPEKYNHLIFAWHSNDYIPLYINFFQNNEHMMIWDLRTVGELEKTTVQIFDPGDEQVKIVERYLLPIRKGHYYKFNSEKNKYKKQW